MANQAKMTEHTGPKKAKGAYAGRKKDAKRESNKLRRLQSRKMTQERPGGPAGQHEVEADEGT